MKLNGFIMLMIIFMSITSCKKTYNGVVSFPEKDIYMSIEQMELDAPKDIENLPVGLIDIKIQDSLLLFATKDGSQGFYKIYKLPEIDFIGEYVHAGNGPGELKRVSYFSKMDFRQEGDSLQIYLPDSKRNLIKWNLTRTLEKGHADFAQVASRDNPDCFGIIEVDDSTLFCHGLGKDGTSICRYLIRSKEINIPSHFQTLNSFHVTRADRYAFNILTSIIAYNESLRRIVEVGSTQNIINIYDLDGDFQKSLQIGPALEGVEEKHPETWPDAYYHLKHYDSFFAALYYGLVSDDSSKSTDVIPTIRFIDWDGHPLFEVVLQTPITSFDIDFASETLYTLDSTSEIVYAYNFTKILEKLQACIFRTMM